MDERHPLDGPERARLERDALPSYLPRQRWFADKGKPVAAVRLADTAGLAGGRATFALADVSFADANGAAASVQRYFVPVARAEDRAFADADVLERATIVHSSDGTLVDAFANDAFVRALVADIRTERTREGRQGRFIARASAAFADLDLTQPLGIHRMSVEQSNTSVVAGERAMLKGYRRVHAGPQPELEIARFLDSVGYRNTPAWYGSLEYVDESGESTALAIVQAFVAASGDGWATTLAFLERAFGIPSDVPLAAFDARMRRLGSRTGELHLAFATPTDDPAFAAEPVTAHDLAAWTAQAQASAARALEELSRAVDRLPRDVGVAANALLERRDEVFARVRVPSLGGEALVKTRYHGDFHLGQVLSVGDDYVIVDFEGEPGRPLAERRAKSSPLRDVAGMLRSIDYAATAGAAESIDASARPEERTALARAWQRTSAAAFLEGYEEAMETCPSIPRDPLVRQRLLDLFTLEKACYELSYELANRPAWVRIPLSGIAAILDAKETDAARTQ